MRNTSKRIASKGLELACFVAERLGSFPEDRTGAFAFSWEPSDCPDRGFDDGGGGGSAWDAGGEGEVGRPPRSALLVERACFLFLRATGAVW